MKLETLSLGAVEYGEEDVYSFEQGVPGFEELQRYLVIQPDRELPFCFMQSTEDASISFIVMNPFLLFPDYQFDLSQAVKDELLIGSDSAIAVWCIVSVGDRQEATINLLAPIVLNIDAKKGRQIILHQSAYKTKHPLTGPANQEATTV
ncbi:MAG: flagellar assembly protein FliW [Paenibacillaceae bacterium]|nr:flagellar assembly protein FliW [Paenibacillaceae bacterium]